MRAIAAVLAVGLCAVGFVETGRAGEANWNQFRGPRGDGSTTAKGLPTKFGEGSPEIVWKTPVTGRAWSSPVVWGDQVWLTNAPEVQNAPKEKPKLDTPSSQPANTLPKLPVGTTNSAVARSAGAKRSQAQR